MREHLSQPGYDSDTLAARMSLTKPGQITWVDLALREVCTACRFYRPNQVARGEQKGFGRCGLVKAHTKKDGAAFDGKSARACGKFEGL